MEQFSTCSQQIIFERFRKGNVGKKALGLNLPRASLSLPEIFVVWFFYGKLKLEDACKLIHCDVLPCWCGQRLCATGVCHRGRDWGAVVPVVQVSHVLCIASCVALSLKLCMAPRAIRLCAPQYTEEPVRGVRCTLHPYSVVCPTGSERAELPQLQQQGVSRLLTLRFWAP